jgi:hypothetical protein
MSPVEGVRFAAVGAGQRGQQVRHCVSRNPRFGLDLLVASHCAVGMRIRVLDTATTVQFDVFRNCATC